MGGEGGKEKGRGGGRWAKIVNAFVPRASPCVKTCYDFYLIFPMTFWGGELGISKNVFSSVIILNIF